MSNSSRHTRGFGERGQEPLADIPTEPEAFLRWSSARPREEGRYELADGRVIRTMINVSRAHARVAMNIAGELFRLLDADRYDIGLADFAVRTHVGVRSPDVVVDRASPDVGQLSTAVPIFICEVLSPSTAGVDFTAKLQEYSAIGSLQTYLICSQGEPRAWYWLRQADGSWPENPKEVSGREGAIPLGGLDIELAMAAVFRGIPDAPVLV